MNTVCFSCTLNDNRTRIIVVRDYQDVILSSGTRLKAFQVKVGEKAYFPSSDYLGLCIEHTQDDPNADILYMDEYELKQEIRKLRKQINDNTK